MMLAMILLVHPNHEYTTAPTEWKRHMQTCGILQPHHITLMIYLSEIFPLARAFYLFLCVFK